MCLGKKRPHIDVGGVLRHWRFLDMRPGTPRSGWTLAVALLATAGLAATTAAATAGVAAPSNAYRANDYADGRAMSILPPGENGLVNPTDLAKFELTKTRPAASNDQLGKYTGLIYGSKNLTDAGLSSYYNDESFGVKPTDITRTEKPGTGVTIYRDTHDVPHVYGNTDQSMAFGAGYVQAEDRLFLMDVLRHYGAGNLSSFLGPSCDFEQMDHDQLLLSAYTPAEAQAQVDALPKQYGAQGTLAKSMLDNYVAGVNEYVKRTHTNAALLPADYAAALTPPQAWTDGDVVSIAGLIGGIFGRGGGGEVANAALLQYLQKQLGRPAGASAFHQFKAQNDPAAPTTVVDKTFPYAIAGKVDPATTALPDDARAALTGGPTSTTSGCKLTAPSTSATAIMTSLAAMPKHLSNALVVNGKDSADGHPIAVFGPQVSYFAPQILMLEDLHSPTYAAEGASFPGTGLVELGRGVDYAWSATSSGSDIIDQRLEQICSPSGGTPTAQGTAYLFKGKCLPMTHETYSEVAVTKPGGVGLPTVLSHEIYKTSHGIVQGWTTSGGKPVAVVNQRSTYGHDIDSIVGFLRWGQPALTHDVSSWMKGAAEVQYTFNWFYVDNRDTGYFTSGLDPIRPKNVDPALPSWGTGNAEWQAYLSAADHVQEINPAQGFFVSWNNKPAPGFSASDEQFGYGQVYRSVLLVNQLKAQLAVHKNRLSRANVVQAMETAATQDLDGVTVVPQLLAYLQSRSEPAGVRAMLTQLQQWTASGAHRKKAVASDSQYDHAAAVAIDDVVIPAVIRAIYDPLLAGDGLGPVGTNGGATALGYNILPMPFINTPNSGGKHLGSAFDAGYEGYLLTTLQQLRGQSPADAFSGAITKTWCGGGPSSCGGAIDKALAAAYQSLVTANAGATSVASWTLSPDAAAAKQTMPVFDAIQFRALGVVGQPAQDWQNRPTFQQVVSFPRHRTR
jgi:acyl-homoserine lactone acylase PvdQ